MKLKVETEEKKQKILLVDKKPGQFFKYLKENLKKFDSQVFVSPRLPNNLEIFDLCFLINQPAGLIDKFDHRPGQKIIFIYIDNQPMAGRLLNKLTVNNITGVKIVNLDREIKNFQDSLDKLLWFALSKSNEQYLDLKPMVERSSRESGPEKSTLSTMTESLNKKNIFLILLGFFILFHLVFFVPLFLSGYSFLISAKEIKKGNFDKAKNKLDNGLRLLSYGKTLYSASRPTYLLFSLALWPDDIVQIDEKAGMILKRFLQLNQQGRELTKSILKKNKTDREQESFDLLLRQIKTNLDPLEEDLIFLNQKLPRLNSLKNIKLELSLAGDLTGKAKQIIHHLDLIMAKNTEKKYLLLFANNMELRPGGGFIGSFGVLKMADYTLQDLKIYDVYDADGQLIAHIPPPEAISKYLEQPHWFLRDSAFSGDFLENYGQAKFFLEKELGLGDFSGAALITTSAVNNILGAFGNLYLSDFRENVNQDNFYLKAQLYSEKDFFPGSTQKKGFLASVTRALLINLETASFEKLIMGVKKSLDEKQAVLYLDDEELQKIIDSYYWSGRIIQPVCPTQIDSCISDYVFPLDANLGVNKANFYITRLIELKINVDSQGNFENTLTIKFKNNSPNEVFPGGYYRNYLQILIPKNSTIKTITKNDVLVDEFDEKDEEFKNVGLFFEIEPLGTAEIRLRYQPPLIINKGHSVYQLLFQKQIGSFNNDLNIRIFLPKNIYLINQNFSPLVKDNQILYNTSLSADKIFFIELIKE